MRLAGNPHKLFLMTALEKKRLNRFDSFFDHLLNELFITGTPPPNAAFELHLKKCIKL